MNKKQSLFHIAKRDTLPWYKSFAIRGCAILLALVVCAVVTMLLTGENPVNIFATIFKGAFGSARKSWVTFQNLAVLLGISLAVRPPSKCAFGTSALRVRCSLAVWPRLLHDLLG